ncbi:hypothetical protein ER308_14245 [Egibacter rhizosphaerae]|uniref:Hemolysin III family protein n=1 Tax=Egibacter rhizosphaerae TaxID=1670831 RepID=A0A411YH69_9ACTN|nr:hemolysin III family protein [Egibacter rhizosphaerae]QBI20604.1 hypothetical protein ER308_14245 [Egibacter rhizosphaerae]
MTTAATLATAARPDGRPWLRGAFHGLAVPLAVLGFWLLWESANALATQATVIVFGSTLVGLYTVSSLYHLVPWSQRVRALLARFDGAMIQLFIAGSFTPVAFHTLDGSWRTWSLVVAWGVAGIGALIAASPLTAPRWLSTAGYIAVGWLAVVPMSQIVQALPWEGVGLIVLGGFFYTLGAVVYALKWPDPFPSWLGFHEIFHLLVIAASTAHYFAIWQYVLG